MTSAGEKQHYALTLLNKLFEHIPETMRIGVLYDIGCQLHRSCEKFGFLDDIIDRLVFGISVFHAYGHQWPCQIIYHPRKCKGFGLTDGEGCEHFWSSIKSLIPSCRVSTYFNRIYTIDTQIKALHEKSLFGMGKWLHRKWIVTKEKKSDSENVLQTVDSLEWNAQVTEQTKPLKRQSKNLANKEIEEILSLNKVVETYKSRITELQNMLDTGEYEHDMDLLEVQEFLQDLMQKLEKTQKAVANKKAKLSVDGKQSLKKLMGNEFLKHRMNALALKQRIRDRLRQRKFELENLERAYQITNLDLIFRPEIES
ncbi:hypothetical protein BDZ97DRAFT_1904311 [Flammula alnicola]|nr:hypothetical protein BDZ97DRAFT_1904311 [Flammula alnicola]